MAVAGAAAGAGVGIYVGLALGAASLAASAYSAYAAYEANVAQQRAIQYQRRQSEIQQKQARDAAMAAAERKHAEHARILAAQRMALGASGVTGTEGSSLILQVESAMEAALDEERVRAAGEAYSTGFANEGKIFRWQGNRLRTGGQVALGTSLLGSAATTGYNVYSGYRSPAYA